MSSNRIVRIEGTAIPLRGDDIDTDRIIPARFLKAITFEGLGDHAFEDDRQLWDPSGGRPRHPFDDDAFRGASILVVGRNFGCGSSREHAPQALVRRGIKAIVGESFSEIFFGNAVLLGLPCLAAERGRVDELLDTIERDPQQGLAISLEDLVVRIHDRTIPVTMPGPVREAFMEGLWDATGQLLDGYDDVRRTAARLPYIGGF